MSLRTALAAALIAIAAPALAAAENTNWPNYREGDFVIADCGGSVISMSSNVALMGVPGRDCYTAAKGGIAAITRSLAVAYAPQRVRVNAIAPSATMTERVRRLVAGNTALTKLADSHLSHLRQVLALSQNDTRPRWGRGLGHISPQLRFSLPAVCAVPSSPAAAAFG